MIIEELFKKPLLTHVLVSGSRGFSVVVFFLQRKTWYQIQLETQRQATQYDCLPRLLGDGDYNKVKKCAVRRIIFCTGLTRGAKAGQKIYCTGTTSPTNQIRKDPDPSHMFSKSPHLPQFQQSTKAAPLCAEILEQSLGARQRVGIGLS